MECTNKYKIKPCNHSDGKINQSVNRRSASYKPNIWNYDHLQSLGREFDEDKYRIQAPEMIEEVKKLFHKIIDPVEKLELVDSIVKLGLSIHFKKEIDEVLESFIYLQNRNSNFIIENDLYATSTCFRMLRVHGCNVSQDMFKGFMDQLRENVNLNVKTMLAVFEASNLAFEGEDILEEARNSATVFLKNLNAQWEGKLPEKIARALELPLNLAVEWFNVRNHIHNYGKEENAVLSVLMLAKLNFNRVQAVHQRDLKDILRWWMLQDTTEILSFTRNRIVECYLWATGVAFEPEYGSIRKLLTKVTKLVIIIDDFYDVYGTLEELEIFTKAVERWNFERIELLPESMMFCIKMLYDTVDEISKEMLEGKGWTGQQHIQNAWIEFCKGLLEEARWYHNHYTPNLEEYLANGWVTSCGPLLSIHVVYVLSQGAQEEANEFLKHNHDLVYNTSMIIRLCNDQGTTKAEIERGDAPTSIICYMREAFVSEEVARKLIADMITHTWKKINNVCMSQYQPIKCITNMARVAHFIYLKGDGFGIQDKETREQVLALLVEPLPLH